MSAAAPNLLIFPCNGNGIEALDCLGDRYRCIGFVDDTPEKQRVQCHGVSVMSRTAFAAQGNAAVLAVPGSPLTFRSRRSVIEGLSISADRFAQVIHPSARISPLARIGRNVLIMAGVVITSDAVIGDHVCILPNTVLHHGVAIGDWTLVGSNVVVAGNVLVGRSCYIGSGTNIMNGIAVGEGALVGLGSNVIEDIPAASVVAGNPARPIKVSSDAR